MFLLRKPHRVAFLLPEVHLEGTDAVLAHEVALVLWIACIETGQRHPELAVYDPESTPLVPTNGHFTPLNASIGATPSDAFFATTRRDEVVWLELRLGAVVTAKLHAIARDGTRQSFEGTGRRLGDQIDDAFASWVAARGLRRASKRFEPVTADELIGVVRLVSPVLGEHTRTWSVPTPSSELEPDDVGARITDVKPGTTAASKLARSLANRLPATLKVPTLRLFQLVLRESFDELILASDPEHPQALFASYRAGERRDVALLRKVIAAAPFWARPYTELSGELRATPDSAESQDRPRRAPTQLEAVACAGIAALCRPAWLEVIEQAAARLHEARLSDEGARLLERALPAHADDSAAHRALLAMLRHTDRPGALLEQTTRSRRAHGCPGRAFPWFADQIAIDLAHAEALLRVGRLEEAIALATSRIEGRETSWASYERMLDGWRTEPAVLATCYAREAHVRGDPARVVEGMTCTDPATGDDLATLIDALIALGREHEIPLAWGQFGYGRGLTTPTARLAAARGLFAAEQWRRGMEELWRVELTAPGRDDQAVIARCGLLLSSAPIELLEAALVERLSIGAATLARRMARDLADFVPDAGSRPIVQRALGTMTPIDFDPAWLAGFAGDTPGRKAIDAMFAEQLTPRRFRRARGTGELSDVAARADRLVNRWLEVVFTDVGQDNPERLAQAAAYMAAQALGRYLAATTAPSTPIVGALRTVAGEALALVRRNRSALSDGDARAVLGALEVVIRRVDRWLGTTWLATVERSCGLDERAAGDLAGFVRGHATVAARLLGPEETAVLAASIAQLHRDRPEGWASAVSAQAIRLAMHTGYLGAEEWAEATATQLAQRQIDADDAIDALHTACYLTEGITAAPSIQAARVMLELGRAPAATALLGAGLGAASPATRERTSSGLAELWARSGSELSLSPEQAARDAADAIAAAEWSKAERLARWAVALDPADRDARRQLAKAFVRQGKLPEALGELEHCDRGHALDAVVRMLSEAHRSSDLLAVLDYASRWYARADQWTSFAVLALGAGDAARAAMAFTRAHQIDPSALDEMMVSAHARARAEIQRAEPSTRVRSLGRRRETVFGMLEAGAHAEAGALFGDDNWRARRGALAALRFRTESENHLDVTPRARSAAFAVLSATVGTTDHDALLCRVLAMEIREQAYFARDPVPPLGTRMAGAEFHDELRRRGGMPVGEATISRTYEDRVIVPGSEVPRISDYVALIRELALHTPGEALPVLGLDETSYLELARAWGAAMAADPTIAGAISARLAAK
ncbi:MAG: hypothetical protein AB7O24_00710 [Kofleriaceae bacterium]